MNDNQMDAVVCKKHGKMTSTSLNINIDGLNSMFFFCGLCFGEWIAGRFPVRPAERPPQWKVDYNDE